MNQWSFYRVSDGHFTGESLVSTDGRTLSRNVPEGCEAIEGHFDHLSQRFDLEARRVVDYVPPQPDADHEWNAEAKRWVKRSDVRERERRRDEALRQIAELERRQARPLRELHIDPDNPVARERLREIEREIANLRGALT